MAVPHMTEAIFWGGLLSIAVIGSVVAVMRRKEVSEDENETLTDESEVMETVQDLEIEPDEAFENHLRKPRSNERSE